MINPDELLFSVDEHNNPIEPQPRALSHETGIWHRSCHVWIMNDNHEILSQQRSLQKDTNPGKWEPFFGGHLAPGQQYVDAAIQETKEELGLAVSPEQLTYVTEYRYVPGTEYQAIFILHWNGDLAALQLEKEEVEQVAWKSIDEIEQQVVRANTGQWSYMGYEEVLLGSLKNNSII